MRGRYVFVALFPAALAGLVAHGPIGLGPIASGVIALVALIGGAELLRGLSNRDL